jgi:hypothetical protein
VAECGASVHPAATAFPFMVEGRQTAFLAGTVEIIGAAHEGYKRLGAHIFEVCFLLPPIFPAALASADVQRWALSLA